MTALTILGGWLGAGKTTWLRHQLLHGLSAHIIVNEAAGVAVDDALLPASGLTLLAGGCACCDGQPALLAALRDLVDRRSAGKGILDIVLETSGLADPAAILRAVQADPVLVHHFRRVETVVLVDALHAPAELANGTLALAQIRAADRLILTKTDTAPAGQVARLVATLRLLSPGTMVGAAVTGVTVPLDASPANPFPISEGLRPVTAVTLPIPPGADWAALSLWLGAVLHAHGDRLIRIKGVVQSPAGRLLIQTVRNVVQQPEVIPQGLGVDDTLAVIGEAPDAVGLQRSLHRFLGKA